MAFSQRVWKHKLWELILYFIAGDLNTVGDRVLVAKGGAGGGPDNHFATQQGHSLSVSLDLKLIADVGLVGSVHLCIFALALLALLEATLVPYYFPGILCLVVTIFL